MKTKELNVPADAIEDFADILEEHHITNEIKGRDEEGYLIIEVQYEKEERPAVFKLLELLDEYEPEDEE